MSAQTLKLVNEHTVFSEVVTDQEAVKAVERFVGEYNLRLNRCTADGICYKVSCETDLPVVLTLSADDEKVLVEPACGAALSAVYNDVIKRLQDEGKLARRLGPVVIVVCGGNNISMEQLRRLKKLLGII